MVLSTPIPTEIAAMVIVIISSGIFSQPMMPRTKPAAMIFGTIQIAAIFSDRNKVMNMSMMANNTTPRVNIWDWNRLCNMGTQGYRSIVVRGDSESKIVFFLGRLKNWLDNLLIKIFNGPHFFRQKSLVSCLIRGFNMHQD